MALPPTPNTLPMPKMPPYTSQLPAIADLSHHNLLAAGAFSGLESLMQLAVLNSPPLQVFADML